MNEPLKPLRITFCDAITDVDAAHWNAITGTDYPFTRHEFLAALELSGAVSESAGWLPYHVLVHRGEQLVALMPLYIKHHSFGEYVFDWSWADAYQRHGLNYYPKLVAAIPFTPTTGPRLCVAEGEDIDAITAAVTGSVQEEAARIGASSCHLLFPDETLSRRFATQHWLRRTGVQYHWFNDNYGSYEDFLGACVSRKRKNLRRERRRVSDQGVTLRRYDGADIDALLWRQFYRFYQLTYAKRSGHGGYLNRAFFELIGEQLPEHIMLVVAEHRGEAIAGALNFRDSQQLYGRYWGAVHDIDCLHFEACYYQGIDYCIERGLQRFNPGAQGEHKIQRGFTPIKTWSNHWVAHPDFSLAIEQALLQEARGIDSYLQEAADLLPFKQQPR